jgi:hypothetical protein
MPRALPIPLRQQIVQLRRDGVALTQIARQLDQKYRTVRAIWYRYCDQGEAGLEIHYDRCGPRGSSYPEELVEVALALKRDHPRWGGVLIRLELARRFPDIALPHPRTLQRWWSGAGLTPLRARLPQPDPTRARAVHATWQVDAKERMTLADGSGACSLTATDEASGTLVEMAVFPPVSLGAGATGGGAGGDA